MLVLLERRVLLVFNLGPGDPKLSWLPSHRLQSHDKVKL